MRPRPLLFGPTNTSPAIGFGLLVLRLGVGLGLALAHGLGKIPPSPGFVETTATLGFPLPGLFAWAAALAEFAGGLLLAIGFLTRPAGLFVAFTLAVAFFGQHGGESFGDRELSFLYMTAGFALAVSGAGRYSVDALIRRRDRLSYA
jgi:putative oxidoreductase